jgi:hypothetical protein
MEGNAGRSINSKTAVLGGPLKRPASKKRAALFSIAEILNANFKKAVPSR